MKYLILVLLLSGCSVQLKDDRIDPVKLDNILREQSAVMVAMAEKIQELKK